MTAHYKGGGARVPGGEGRGWKKERERAFYLTGGREKERGGGSGESVSTKSSGRRKS